MSNFESTFGSERVLKAQTEPFPVLVSRAPFLRAPPRAQPALLPAPPPPPPTPCATMPSSVVNQAKSPSLPTLPSAPLQRSLLLSIARQLIEFRNAVITMNTPHPPPTLPRRPSSRLPLSRAPSTSPPIGLTRTGAQTPLTPGFGWTFSSTRSMRARERARRRSGT